MYYIKTISVKILSKFVSVSVFNNRYSLIIIEFKLTIRMSTCDDNAVKYLLVILNLMYKAKVSESEVTKLMSI